jgi:hypothetical protein
MRLDPAAGMAMLAASLLEKTPLALARRVLAVLITLAVALAPVGAAASTANAPSHTHHSTMPHGHGAMPMATKADAARHCEDKSAHACCCDDKGTCAQTCLQKCFGQVAVMPPERTARIALAFRVAPLPAERPPGWSSAPQLPPPRA